MAFQRCSQAQNQSRALPVRELITPSPKLRLMDQVQEVMRLKHYWFGSGNHPGMRQGEPPGGRPQGPRPRTTCPVNRTGKTSTIPNRIRPQDDSTGIYPQVSPPAKTENSAKPNMRVCFVFMILPSHDSVEFQRS